MTATTTARAVPRARDGAARRGLAAPTVVESLHKLAALVGPAEALEAWSRAAVASGRHGTDLSAEELVDLAQHLVLQGDVVGVFARGLAARCRAYVVLLRHGG